MRHRWRGNVRELEHVLERTMILGDGDLIALRHLADDLRPSARRRPHGPPRAVRFRRHHILDVLAQVRLDKRAAARMLGISLASLYRKLSVEPPGGSLDESDERNAGRDAQSAREVVAWGQAPSCGAGRGRCSHAGGDPMRRVWIVGLALMALAFASGPRRPRGQEEEGDALGAGLAVSPHDQDPGGAARRPRDVRGQGRPRGQRGEPVRLHAPVRWPGAALR